MEVQNKKAEEPELEELFLQLEKIMAALEAEDVSLEKSFELYHQGMDMLKTCNDKIDSVEKKMLMIDNEGKTYEF